MTAAAKPRIKASMLMCRGRTARVLDEATIAASHRVHAA